MTAILQMINVFLELHLTYERISLHHPIVTGFADAIFYMRNDASLPLVFTAVIGLPFAVQSQIVSEEHLGWQKSSKNVALVELHVDDQVSWQGPKRCRGCLEQFYSDGKTGAKMSF